MKKIISFPIIISFTVLVLNAQTHLPLDHQLRLEPVWARVADALGEPGSVESAEFSRDGKFIVSGTKFDNSVIMWRTSDGREMWRQYTEEEIERVGWSADGKFVAAGSEDYLVTVYDASTGEVYKTLKHERGIDGLTWSNQGSLLVTGQEKIETDDGETSGYIRVFEMPEANEVISINFGNTVNELFFSADDRFLLAVGHGAVKIYRTDDWSLLRTLDPGYYVTFTSGVFSPDAKYVFAVGQGGTSRGNCYLWDWKEEKLVKMFNDTGKKIESVSWHPNGGYIAYSGHMPYIFVYRLSDIIQYKNDVIPVAHKVWSGDHAEYLDFNSDGSFLVSAHQNGLIKLWVWMGENPNLNEERHSWVKTQQTDAKKEE
jgi:WD40 repeat protein